MAPATEPNPKDPSSGLRVPLLIALLLAAGAVLFLQPRVVSAVRTEQLDARLLLVAPAIFALVVVLAALDAWRSARRRGYFRGPSVVVIAACVAFLGLLAPNTVDEYRARTSPPADSVAYREELFKSSDPRVRALVLENAGWVTSNSNDAVAGLVLRGLNDSDPLVVQAAVMAVEHRIGTAVESADRAKVIVQSWGAR